MDALFPGIYRNTTKFGALSRKRTLVFKVLFEWLFSHAHMDFALARTPALCIYGQQDPILNLGGGTLKSASIDCIRKVCSPVTFHAINSDHFLSDPESRAAARQTIRSFLQTV